MYTAITPEYEPAIKTYVNYNIDDNIPDEKAIVKTLYKMKLGKSPGASGISIDEILKHDLKNVYVLQHKLKN